MSDDYARLFNARGQQYDRAMVRYPQARDAEFLSVVALAGVQAGDCVADIPCGGGYLARYLPEEVSLYSVDSSDVFANCLRASGNHQYVQCPIDQVPLASASLDHIVSLAGLHHVASRPSFWQECARLLKSGGVLTVADVAKGSRVALFLDGVVDKHTVTGHCGVYFDEHTVGELEAAGFDVEKVETRRIAWRAGSLETLADFCHLLFGLNGIEAGELAPLLLSEVGVEVHEEYAELHWELMFFRAIKR